MTLHPLRVALTLALVTVAFPLTAATLRGKVVNFEGQPLRGAMVSAFNRETRQITSVFSQADGSFAIDGLEKKEYELRARRMGQVDVWLDEISGDTQKLEIEMETAEGEDLEEQRPATSGFSMLKFDNIRDKLNFKMMCSYCHQVGTIPFRTPEQPVDWETMLRRMDGFGGLYRHTQETIIPRRVKTYNDDAVLKWPKFVPPPTPSGLAVKAKITAWEIGKWNESTYHDLELGPDGLVYLVNIQKNRLVTLDPKNGETVFRKFPRGTGGAHSIELANDGNMWVTMCGSGHMAKFDLESQEFSFYSSAEAPARRGSYPHTLRIDPKDSNGTIWYTDAGRNSVFRMDPSGGNVREYHLLRANQAVAAGKGESKGITPYGLDYSPVDGMIWYSKLNGNRIGRIDPKSADGSIKEWNPPFRGPRRLHVAPNGIVWVPGFASGVFGAFDPKTETWKVYPLPDADNQIPYALNVDKKGIVWICGTGNDSLYRFDPKTEYLVEFPLPMRVSYTREIEFDDEGNVWTSTSGPPRHMERGYGMVIKLELPADIDEIAQTGGMKLSTVALSDDHFRGEPPRKRPQGRPREGKPGGRNVRSTHVALLELIAREELPPHYEPHRGRNAKETHELHQGYVDRVMARLTSTQGQRVGMLWKEQERVFPKMKNRGASFVRILAYVARGERTWAQLHSEFNGNPPPIKGARPPKVAAATGSKPTPKKTGKNAPTGRPATIEEKTKIHRLQSKKRATFDAFVYANRIPEKPDEAESPVDFAGRIFGRLANQEGRILLKLPPGMDRKGYDGFKAFLGSEGNPEVTNCVPCHSPAEFTDDRSHVVARGAEAKPTTSLRNLGKREVDIRKVVLGKIALSRAKRAGKADGVDDAYSRIHLTGKDVDNVVTFLKTLDDVGDDDFRRRILEAKVVHVTH